MTRIELHLPQYERYKESEIDWINQVPLHWETKALKYIAKLQSGDTIRPEQFTEEGYPVFGGNGFRGYTKSFNNVGRLPLIGRQGALCGNVNYSSGHFFASEHAVVVYPKSESSITWIGETIRAANFNRLSQSTAQPGIAVAMVENQQFPYPPPVEQKAIAEFIDQKSAQIDQAIQIKERQIERLKERKQILIRQAVTRGLDPHALMRDSGIEWIGEIPAHWQTRRFKYLFSQSQLPVRPDDGVVTSYRDGQVTLRSNRRLAGYTEAILEGGYQGVRKGQLVLNSMDAFEGAIGVSESNGKCTPEYVVCDSLSGDYLPEYFAYLLREMALARYIQVICNAVRQRAVRIRFNNLAFRFMVVPPIEEQRAIVALIKAETEKQDAAMALLEQQITKLKEYKATLINSAVTGKVKVPGVVEPHVQDMEVA